MDLRVLYFDVIERLEDLDGLTSEDVHAAARDAVLLVMRRRLIGRRHLRVVPT